MTTQLFFMILTGILLILSAIFFLIGLSLSGADRKEALGVGLIFGYVAAVSAIVVIFAG